MSNPSHLDEKIIRLIDVSREKKAGPANRFASLDIRTGTAVIGGTRFNFAATPLLDGKLQMMIPEDFQSIPPEKFYKPESKPDLMLTDQSGAIQITLLHTKKEVTNDAEVASHKSEVRQILESLNSSLDWQSNDTKEVNGKRIEYFELITPVLGSLVYNLTFFMQLQQRILTGSFICTERHLKGWKPVFHQMLESIKVITPETVNTTLTHPDYSTYPFKSGQYGFHNGQEYRLYKVGADQYSLISHNPKDLENGFVAKDGVFRKIVTKSEITAAYEIQLTILYRGHQFEFAGQGIQATRIKLLAKNCSPTMIKELQLEKVDNHEYVKIIDKTEIENVIEKRLPVAGFAMPEHQN